MISDKKIKEWEIKREIYIPFLYGILKKRKIWQECKKCYKLVGNVHLCCKGCNKLINDSCSERNLNCLGWFCKRTIKYLSFFDLMNFSLVLNEIKDDKLDFYRSSVLNPTNRHHWFGAINIFLVYFRLDKKLTLKAKIKINSIKLKLKTFFSNGKHYGCE